MRPALEYLHHLCPTLNLQAGEKNDLKNCVAKYMEGTHLIGRVLDKFGGQFFQQSMR